jgi:alpha-ribazole phosphatase
MILWTLRHTTPDVPRGVCYGRSDFDVAPSFSQEYPPALSALDDCRASRVLSSPLLRCRRLAEKVAEHLHLPLEIAPALSEIHFGDWENKHFHEIPDADKAAWRANLRHYRFPGGESFHDVGLRVADYVALTHAPGDELLWVTHAGIISALMHAFGGVPDDDFVEGKLGYGTLVRFDFSQWKPFSAEAVPYNVVYPGVPQMPFG